MAGTRKSWIDFGIFWRDSNLSLLLDSSPFFWRGDIPTTRHSSTNRLQWGLSAALGARRAGADVMLLERYGCFGGVVKLVLQPLGCLPLENSWRGFLELIRRDGKFTSSFAFCWGPTKNDLGFWNWTWTNCDGSGVDSAHFEIHHQ